MLFPSRSGGFVAEWIDVEQSASVHFRVILSSRMIGRCLCLCPHPLDEPIVWTEGCRPCQINKALRESEVEIQWQDDPLNHARILWGTAETDAQKIAVTRMIALARGDIEPLTLVEARLAGLVG